MVLHLTMGGTSGASGTAWLGILLRLHSPATLGDKMPGKAGGCPYSLCVQNNGVTQQHWHNSAILLPHVRQAQLQGNYEAGTSCVSLMFIR